METSLLTALLCYPVLYGNVNVLLHKIKSNQICVYRKLELNYSLHHAKHHAKYSYLISYMKMSHI